MKKALITGITGQDGSYLAEFLYNKGYHVFGIQRRSSVPNTFRIDKMYDKKDYPKFITVYGDLADSSNLSRIIGEIKPDEIYNLGAQSHVGVSFEQPEFTGNITGLGPMRILDIIRSMKLPTRFYQASSSEMFGKALETPQRETTPFNPQSPYGASKVFGFHATRIYRGSYGIFASNGILFNHESPRRGITFVTRKITLGLARVKIGLQKTLKLGNLDAKRDWGYAKDYVEAMWLILQHHKPDDFIIATGKNHSVREFVEEVGRNLGMDIVWKGKGVTERGIDRKTGKTVIEVDPVYFRPLEVDTLLGNPTKARKILGWKPKTTFKELAKIMTESDLKIVELEAITGGKIEVRHFPVI